MPEHTQCSAPVLLSGIQFDRRSGFPHKRAARSVTEPLLYLSVIDIADALSRAADRMGSALGDRISPQTSQEFCRQGAEKSAR